MNDMSQLLDTIRRTADCFVMPTQGFPTIDPNHVFPDDLIEFYRLCGGISLFRTSAYSIEIVPPSHLVLANPVIYIGVDENELGASKNDISWSWYIIGEGDNRQLLSIDLAIERLGRCYDSFWDCHAMPGYSPIIAQSFTELLVNLHANQGRHWYWLQPDFRSIGDAYE
jgi:hypothetical protein